MIKLLFAFVYMGMPYDAVSLLVFLAVAAGEASIGLSLLISILRQRGKDKFKMSEAHSTSEGF